MSNLDIKKVKELVWISEHPNEVMAERVECLRVLQECDSVLIDYIETIEKTGASLFYGKSVLDRISVLIQKLEKEI